MTVDAFNPGKPFYLYIGRKRQRVTEPARLEVENYYQRLSNDDFSPIILISRTYKLFIGDKLTVSATVHRKRRYQHAAIVVREPKRGLMQIRFTKKYATVY